jgi:putative AlgH/UPF0301 family transcriptional regulator
MSSTNGRACDRPHALSFRRWHGPPEWHHKGMSSSLAPGFLVAAPILRDPNFAGSVVLMVEHSELGALGFVVNRVAGASLRRVLERLEIADTPVNN